jgi:DNA-binding CsgD family transcriptional regulator
MLKARIEALDFFRYLVYLNIDELSDEKKMRLMGTIMDIATMQLFKPQIDIKKLPISVVGGGDSELLLRDIQAWFRDKFLKIMTNISKAPEKKIKDWSSDERLFGEGFSFRVGDEFITEPYHVNLLPEVIELPNLRISAAIDVKPEYKTEDGAAYARWDPKWPQKSLIRVSTYLNYKYGLLLGFLKTINELPVVAFRFCTACERWYFHLSKRGRKYCSIKCAKKVQAQRHRDKEKIINLKKEGFTEKEIAERLGFTEEYVRQIVKNAKNGRNKKTRPAPD